MFNSMNGNSVIAFITVTHHHTVSVFFYKPEGSFNARSERFQFLIDQTMRYGWQKAVKKEVNEAKEAVKEEKVSAK
ncbi:MAG TPA: hypothetical protein ENO00_01290 [Deltaproteobacteria bacterium]|nr:hypothetical protein [Deltaproteobacteria bacterium]